MKRAANPVAISNKAIEMTREELLAEPPPDSVALLATLHLSYRFLRKRLETEDKKLDASL